MIDANLGNNESGHVRIRFWTIAERIVRERVPFVGNGWHRCGRKELIRTECLLLRQTVCPARNSGCKDLLLAGFAP
ncbi:hypothetical protein [Sphingomonas sp. GB1N7]|uniref:hypothetical protein n=1 Tax=Parasphingomonas caseinilytica TaxID=3096158 RepID=UPI002FC9412C